MRFRVSRRRSASVFYLILVLSLLSLILVWPDRKQPPKCDIVTLAKQYLGTPYRYGGATPAGFDCSGYIMFLFQQFGKELPRTADRQAAIGKSVDIKNLRPGDIVCFATDETDISHTGLYIGDNRFIHASSSAKKVIISDLLSPYWRNAFRSGRQIIP